MALLSAILPLNNAMNFTENQHGNAILEKLKNQKDAGRFCDVVLHVQGKQFPAHRNVLSACSPYFDSILKMQKTVKEQLTVTCHNHEAFHCFLNYMYTGNVVIDKNNVAELLRLANHFLVNKLKSYCAEYLDRYLDITNCLSVKELAEKYLMPALVKNATNFIQNHVADVLQQKELLDCQLPKVELFLSDKNWSIPQDGLLKFTSQWVSYNPNCRERDLRTLLTFVNWHIVDRNFLAVHVDTEPLFKQNPRCFYFILQSLEENGIQLPKYAPAYQELKSKFGPEAAGNFDSDSFLNMAISTAIEGLQDTSGPSPSERERDITFEPVTVTALGKDALYDLTRGVKRSGGKSNGIKPKRKSSSNIISAALVQKGGRRIRPIKLKLGGSMRKKISVGGCTTITTSDGRRLKVLRVRRPQRKALFRQLRRAGFLGQGSSASRRDAKRLVAGSEDDDERSEEGSDGDEYDEIDDLIDSIGGGIIRKKLGHSQDVAREGIKCPHCSFVAQGVLRLEQHVARAHSRDVTYKCGLCDFTCKWNREYYAHIKERHFEGPPFRCDTCDFNCDRVQLLLAHRMKHTDERPFKCSKCEYRCRTKNNLWAHVRSHTVERIYKPPPIDPHMSNNNLNDQRPFLCDICGFSTKYQSHLIAHKRIHTGEVFRCDFPDCSYSSPKKSQLSAHNRTHTAVRSHVCGVCGRGFVEKSHLVRHERIHLNEKPFKCEHCDYSSSRRDKLKEHTQKHHGAHPTAKTPYKPRKPRNGNSASTSGSGVVGSGGSGGGAKHPAHHHHHHHHHHPYDAAACYGGAAVAAAAAAAAAARGGTDLEQAVLHQSHNHGPPQQLNQQQQQGGSSQQQQMSQTPTPSSTMSDSSPTYTYEPQPPQHHLAAAMDLHSKVMLPDLSRSLAAVAAAAAGVADHQQGQQQSGHQQSNAPPNTPVSTGSGLPPHSHAVAAVAAAAAAAGRGQPPPPTMVFDPRYHGGGPTFHHHMAGLDQRPQQPGMHNLNPQGTGNLPHPSDFSGLSAFMALF